MSPLAHLKQAIRSTREALPLLAATVRHGQPDNILRFDGGIGDELLCSAVARELRRRGKRTIWMHTGYPELFRGNPDIAFAPRKNVRGIRRFLEIARLESVALGYAEHVGDRDIAPDQHVITVLCARQGVTGLISRRPYLYLTEQEKAFGRFGTNQIAIQTSGLAAKYAAVTKEWYPERFQDVVNHFRDRFTFVQIGAGRDPLLEGVVDLRGKTAIRETAGVLHNSAVFVGLAGFLQHLARSVECRSVIVYGGRELPSQTGYTCNENVVHRPECSPCWIYGRCEHNVKCMAAIGADQVIEAVKRQLSRLGTPLAEDKEDIPAAASAPALSATLA